MNDREMETNVLRDCFKLLQDFSNAPSIDAPDCEDYFKLVGERMAEVTAKYEQNHFSMKMMMAMFEYLEYKAYRKRAKANG